MTTRRQSALWRDVSFRGGRTRSRELGAVAFAESSEPERSALDQDDEAQHNEDEREQDVFPTLQHLCDRLAGGHEAPVTRQSRRAVDDWWRPGRSSSTPSSGAPDQWAFVSGPACPYRRLTSRPAAGGSSPSSTTPGAWASATSGREPHPRRVFGLPERLLAVPVECAGDAGHRSGTLNNRPHGTHEWRTPPRPSTSTYSCFIKAVMLPPVEPGLIQV